MARASAFFVAAMVVACFFMPLMVSGARGVGTTGSRFVVQGRVFCDTCRAGFETPATTYIEGNQTLIPFSVIFPFPFVFWVRLGGQIWAGFGSGWLISRWISNWVDFSKF